MNTKNIICLSMAALLLLCLLPMPYSFYTIVRIAALITFVYMAYEFFKSNNTFLGIAFSALALVFQPFVKIGMNKTTWNVLDVIVAVVLITCVVVQMSKSKRKNQ